jgi:site-specific recombinase
MNETIDTRLFEQVESYFSPENGTQSAVEQLAYLLHAFIHAKTLRSRLDAFISLQRWLNSGVTPLRGKETRLESLLSLMEARDHLRAGFQNGVREILTEIRSVDLFAEAGLHPRERLWSEAFRRMVARLVPPVGEDKDLAQFVTRLYSSDESIQRLLNMPDVMFQRIARVLSPADDPLAWEKQREDLMQSLRLLGVHVAGIGLSPGLRARSRSCTIENSPFYRLHQAVVNVLREDGDLCALENWRAEVQSCRREIQYVHHRMEDAGVSTALVFDLGTIERALTRMESIVQVLFPAEPNQSIDSTKRLLDDVMNARRSDMSIRELFRENSSLLARKIVERTGKAGEHYIANSRSEYRKIWWASLGGGLLTVLTAALKLRITATHLPPFVDGMAAGTNYAISFLVLHHFHLALATKQPSVTAATFAGIVRTTHGQARLEKLAEFISRITRSQLASAAGNLLAVGLGCLVFELLWVWLFSRPFLEVSRAEYVYQTLNPLVSGTAIFAALTGLILWISALVGGWFENYSVFIQLPKAIAQHPWPRVLGRERMKRLAATVDANLSSWTTSIVLGYLLGFVPAVGRFFGIPLDVRHVTLSFGTLALAAASFGRDWIHRGWFFYTIIGIAITFALNLGVSFSIAAEVAMRAYGVSRKDQLELMRFTLKKFFHSPGQFLFPPSKATGFGDALPGTQPVDPASSEIATSAKAVFPDSTST